MAICFDDLEQSWLTAANALEAHFPAQVHRKFIAPQCPLTLRHHDILDQGHGQDALRVYFRRVYFRLAEAIEWRSWDAAWSLRCARQLLRRWTRVERLESADYVKAEMAEGFTGLKWLTVGAFAATDIGQVLQGYFRGDVLPRDAYDFMSRRIAIEWKHPDSSQTLPDPARSVILQNLARVTDLANLSVLQAGALARTFCFQCSCTYCNLPFLHRRATGLMLCFTFERSAQIP